MMRTFGILTVFALILSSMSASAQNYGRSTDNTRLHSGKGGMSLSAGKTTIDNASLVVCTGGGGGRCWVAVSATIEMNTGAPWSICVLVDEKQAVPACTSQPYSAGNATTGSLISIAEVTGTFHKAKVQVQLTSAGTLGGWGIIYQTYQ